MTDKGEQKQPEKNLSHCLSSHHKSTRIDMGVNLGLHHDKPTTNYLSNSKQTYGLNWYLESQQYVNQNTELCSVQTLTKQNICMYCPLMSFVQHDNWITLQVKVYQALTQ